MASRLDSVHDRWGGSLFDSQTESFEIGRGECGKRRSVGCFPCLQVEGKNAKTIYRSCRRNQPVLSRLRRRQPRCVSGSLGYALELVGAADYLSGGPRSEMY